MPRKTKFVKRNKKKSTGSVKNVKKEVQQLGLLAQALRLGGGAVGGAAGRLFGMENSGFSAGSGLGAAISKWLGSGDYEINRNSIVTDKGLLPAMHSTSESTRVRHREYIGDVVSSATVGGFTTNSFSLNPGLSTTFPWLAGIAQQYQEYSFKGLVFHYVSTSGESVSSTNSSLASVMMATNYRSGQVAPTDKGELLNQYFSCDAKASEDFAHPVECDPKENPFNIQYVRGAAVPVGEDPKMYDLGTFTVASQGCQAASIHLGEIWATYEVELKKPKSSTNQGQYLETAHYYGTNAITASKMGTARTLRFDSIGMTFPFNNQIGFPVGPVGNYCITVYQWGATAVTTIAAFIFTNCTALALFPSSQTQAYDLAPTAASITAGGCFSRIFINIPDPTQAATVAYTNWTWTGTTTADITITQLPADFI